MLDQGRHSGGRQPRLDQLGNRRELLDQVERELRLGTHLLETASVPVFEHRVLS